MKVVALESKYLRIIISDWLIGTMDSFKSKKNYPGEIIIFCINIQRHMFFTSVKIIS